MSGDSAEVQKKEPKEDTRLINWTRWLDEWQQVGNKIACNLKVPLEALLLNYGEDVRRINQEKLLLEYAKITTTFDKYRGNPDFFNLPCSLTRKFKHCLNEPRYFAVKTKQEMNQVPTMEFVETPDHIRQNEKHIISGIRSIFKKWQKSGYRQQQLKKYAARIEQIVPHEPHLQNLIVLGKSLLKDDDDKKTEDTSTARSSLSEKNPGPSVSQHHIPRLFLTINGIELNPSSCDEYNFRKLLINFEYDIKTGVPQVKYLDLSNDGLTTVRINWKKIQKFQLLRDYLDVTSETHQGFYFKKNDTLILPNQKIQLPIWFRIESAGTYSETWELTTQPRLWNSNFRMILVLHSYSYFGDLKNKVDLVVKHIDAQARVAYIKEIIDEIIETQIGYHETPVVPCGYDESLLFQSANLINGRPLFIFEENIVAALKELYENLTRKPDWNYCMKCIRKSAKDADIAAFLKVKKEEVVKKTTAIQNNEYDVVQVVPAPKSAAKGKKRGKQKEKKSKSSKKDKKSSKSSQIQIEEPPPPVEEIKREDYVYSNQSNLWNLIKKLDSPVIINRDREKLFACTQVMSAYFRQMNHMLVSLEEEYGITSSTIYPEITDQLIPISDLPGRLVYEYFECDYLSNKLTERFESGAKRKPKILADIPCEDLEKIHETYFGKTEKIVAKGKSKGKKDGSKKGAGKKKKAGKKGPKKDILEKGKTGEVSVQSFNPYAEQFIYNVTEPEAPQDICSVTNPVQISGQVRNNYKYRQYITVYNCMSQAVDALVDTIDSFECTVSYSTLNTIKECAFH